MSVIGLDIGTTRIKAILHRPRTTPQRVEAADAELPLATAATPVTPSSHGDLRDAEEVVQAAIGCIGDLIDRLPETARAQIEGIGVAALSEEVVLLDDRGRSVGAMPAWYSTVMTKESDAAGLNPSFSWSKLRWAREHLPIDAVERVRRITTLGSYVTARLAGDAVPAIDHSHASRTGFFDIRTARWMPRLVETSGWAADLLPPLVGSGTVLGALADELRAVWRVPALPVAVSGHDHFCAAFAAGVRGTGQLFLSSGTSEAHVLLIDSAPDRDLPPHVQFGRFVDGQTFYLHTHLPSGHLYAHVEQLAGDRLTELEAQALREPVGAGGLTFTPLVGAEPGYSVRGLSARAGGGAFVRAVQEGLALAARELDQQMSDLAGVSAVDVIAAGVATTNPLWRRIRGATSIAPLALVTADELTAVGAAHVFRRTALGEVPTPVARRELRDDPDDVKAYAQLRARRSAAATADLEEGER